MIRLIGILTGSAVAVAFLIVALGIPEFAAPEQAEPEFIGTMTQVAVMHEPLLEPEPAAAQPAEPGLESHPEAAPEPAAVTIPEALPTASPKPIAVVEEAQKAIDQQWYAFWSPFRSEIAADGFVSQLQKKTGLDYRVVKLKPGVYEVAFAYSGDSDIQDKLTLISSATGLDLSGG